MPPWSADRPQVAIRRLGFSHSMSVWPWDHIVTPLGVPRCSCFSLVWPSSGLQTTDDGHWPPSVRQPRCHLMWSASAAPRVPHPVGRALLPALACPALACPSPSAFVPLPPSASACPAACEPLPSIAAAPVPVSTPSSRPLFRLSFVLHPPRYFRGAVPTSSCVPCWGSREEPALALGVCGPGGASN